MQRTRLSFNEAAGFTRRKRPDGVVRAAIPLGFNEAAGFTRRKRRGVHIEIDVGYGFNEAAGFTRRKHGVCSSSVSGCPWLQ